MNKFKPNILTLSLIAAGLSFATAPGFAQDAQEEVTTQTANKAKTLKEKEEAGFTITEPLIPIDIETTQTNLYTSILRWIKYLFDSKYTFAHVDGGASAVTKLLMEFCDIDQFKVQLEKYKKEVEEEGVVREKIKLKLDPDTRTLTISDNILIKFVDYLIDTGNNPLNN